MVMYLVCVLLRMMMFELLIVVIFNVVFVFGLLKDYGFLLCGKYVDLVIIDVLRLNKLFFKF